MPYPKCKIYSDRSHYIAIPHTERPYKPRRKVQEEEIVVEEPQEQEEQESATPQADIDTEKQIHEERESAEIEQAVPEMLHTSPKITTTERRMTRKQLFEQLYAEGRGLKKQALRSMLVKGMKAYFPNVQAAREYVDRNLRRKQRNLIARRIRMSRKANLQTFNYFVTLTYNSAIHTEESFKKKLRTTLSHFADRKGWRYIGVWERSPQKKRLHFHGVFHIPEGTLSGEMEEVNSYSFATHQRQITMQNSFFLKRFGRNDFEKITDENRIGDALSYLMKYIEKSGEKIVYSRGLPQFFISDVMDEDVACTMGEEQEKLVLHDDFGCWVDGEYMGKVSKDTIAKMPKAN